MKLLVNYPLKLSADQRQQLLADWPGIEVIEQRAAPLDHFDGTNVVMLVSDHVPRNLAAWPQLRLVQLLSAGANHLLGHPVFQSRIPVATASGNHGVPIAQYVTCTWLMMAHRMTQVLDFKRTRQWPDRLALAGFPVRGLIAGIIGYGSIGRECARQLSALGMRILAVKRDPSRHADHDYNAWPGTGDPEGQIPAGWYSPEQLAEVLPQCDLVVVTAPATPATHAMLGERQLGWMKRGSRIVIISRGGIVTETALAAALRSGHLAEAAVDCFVQEPTPADHPFFEVPNLIMTPHISGVSNGFSSDFFPLMRENLRRLKAGAPPLNRANPEAGY